MPAQQPRGPRSIAARSPVVLVGVDAGGARSAGLAVTPSGEIVGRSVGSAANPKRQGLEVAATRIAALAVEAAGAEAGSGTEEAGRAAGAASAHGVGIAEIDLLLVAGAGIDKPEHARALRDVLLARGAARQVIVVNDTFAALRAGTSDGRGLAVVAGTGANVIGRGPSGVTTDRGHGIFGGGYALGALAVRAARRGDPRIGAGLAAAIRAWPADPSRRPDASLAQLAPAVLAAAEDGDRFALRLLDRWLDHLESAVRVEVDRLGLSGAPRVVLFGGLIDGSPGLETRLRSAILAAAPRASIHRLTRDPVEGAALLARDAWVAGPEAG